jgi:hypothetical protein
MIEPAAGAASTGPVVEVGSIDPAVEADSVIWTARPRTGRVVTFRASVSKAFRAAALIASVAVEDSAVIAAAAVVDLADAVVIASVVEADLAAAGLAGLADLAAADSGVDDEN